MKNRKGFTLIELIVVIAIIGAAALLVIPNISNWLSKGKGVYYNTIEKELSLLAKDYYVTNNKDLPIELHETKALTMGSLIRTGYINEVFKDYNGSPCNNSYAIITNEGNKKYNYEACLLCDDYETDTEICAQNKSTAPYVNSINRTHQVLTPITETEINTIKDLIGTKTGTTREDITIDINEVNTNVLGNYVFYYSVPSKDIYGYEGLIKIVDTIDPVIHGDGVVTQKGTSINVIESISISDNYYEDEELSITYEEIDVVDINTVGEYQIRITATDPSGNSTEKDITLVVFEEIVTFNPNSRDWGTTSIDVGITLLDVGLTVNSWSYQIGQLQNGQTTWGTTISGTGTTKTVTITEDGISIIKVTVEYADRTLNQTSGQYKKDTTSPECGSITGASTSWTKNNRTISVGCSDEESGCTVSSTQKVFNSTTKIGTISIQNKSGLTTSCSVDAYVDKTSPGCGTITGIPSNPSNNNWTTLQRQISLTCNDSDSKCMANTYTETYTSAMETATITITDKATNTTSCTVPVYLDRTYTVTYNGNGNTGGSTTSSTHTYGTAKNLTTNGFTRTGHAFAGWATSSTGNVVYENSQNVTDVSSTPNQDATLYAKWNANQYTITFNSNGGSAVTAKTQNYGTTVTEPTAPTKSKYTFAGWYSNSSLTTPYTFTTMPDQNITLYAKWTPNVATIVYHINGGTLSGGPSSITSNNSIVYLNGNELVTRVSYGQTIGTDGLNNPDNPNYINIVKTGSIITSTKEWCKTTDGSGTCYSDSSSAYKGEDFCNLDNGNCEVTLYVNWTPAAPTITGTVATNTWATSNTITISGSSAATSVTYKYCVASNNSSTGCTWNTYNSSNKPTYSTTQTKYIFAKAVSAANNESSISSVYILKIDVTPPATCTLTASGTNFVLSGSDEQSGIHTTAPYSFTSASSGFTNTNTIAASDETSYTGWVRDALGNAKSCSKTCSAWTTSIGENGSTTSCTNGFTSTTNKISDCTAHYACRKQSTCSSGTKRAVDDIYYCHSYSVSPIKHTCSCYDTSGSEYKLACEEYNGTPASPGSTTLTCNKVCLNSGYGLGTGGSCTYTYTRTNPSCSSGSSLSSNKYYCNKLWQDEPCDSGWSQFGEGRRWKISNRTCS